MNTNPSQSDEVDLTGNYKEIAGLIYKYYNKLKEKDPNHDLLKYFFAKDGYLILKKDFISEYNGLFAPKRINNGHYHVLDVPDIIEYLKTLKKTVSSLETVVDN